MAYTYDRSPSGDKLTVTRCPEGHLQLMVTSRSGSPAAFVCVAPEDLPAVFGEMLGWGVMDEGQTAESRLAAYRQADWMLKVVRDEMTRLVDLRARLADELAGADR